MNGDKKICQSTTSHPRNVAGRFSIVPSRSFHQPCISGSTSTPSRQKVVYRFDRSPVRAGGWTSALHRRHSRTDDEFHATMQGFRLRDEMQTEVGIWTAVWRREPRRVSFYLGWAGFQRVWPGAQLFVAQCEYSTTTFLQVAGRLYCVPLGNSPNSGDRSTGQHQVSVEFEALTAGPCWTRLRRGNGLQ